MCFVTFHCNQTQNLSKIIFWHRLFFSRNDHLLNVKVGNTEMGEIPELDLRNVMVWFCDMKMCNITDEHLNRNNTTFSCTVKIPYLSNQNVQAVWSGTPLVSWLRILLSAISVNMGDFDKSQEPSPDSEPEEAIFLTKPPKM